MRFGTLAVLIFMMASGPVCDAEERDRPSDPLVAAGQSLADALEVPATEPRPADAPPAKPEVPGPSTVPKLWTGSFELGLSGTEGNSRTLDFRCGAEAKRKTPTNLLSLDVDYHKSANDARETANRTFFDWRWERLFDKSPWTWFVHGTVEHDEFQVYDLRVTADTGVGHQLIKNDRTSLLGRFGAGFSREIGGPDDTWVPELLYGGELEHKLSQRQKLSASVEYAPDVTDWNDFRLKAKAGWEVLLDETMNLSLKLSVLDRYDSTPHGAKPNDLDYSAVLLWRF